MKILIIGNDCKFNAKLAGDMEHLLRQARKKNVQIYQKKLVYEHVNEFFDICFIDLKKDNLDIGIKIIEKMQILEEVNKVICISECEELVFPLFAINPFYFIRKKEYDKDVRSLLKLLLKETKQPKRIYLICNNHEKIVIDLSHVLYIWVVDHKLYIQTLTGRYTEYGKLKKFVDDHADLFVQINRSCAVNIKYIMKYANGKIIMWDGEIIDIGKVYQNTLKNHLKQMKDLK